VISLLLRISPHSLQGTAIETHSHRPSLIVSCVAYDTQVAPALVGQTGAAACTTAGDNLAAVGSGHSLAEAVLLGALELLGLVGARSSHFVLPPEKILPAAPPWGGAALTRRRAEKNSPRTAVDKNSAVLMRHTGSIISVLPHSVNQKYKNRCMFPFPAKPCGAYRTMQLSLVSFCLFFRAFALQKTAFYI
jgi:hypothetical protein